MTFQAEPAAGYYADFYLYASPAARRKASAGEQVTLLVQPNNSGVNSDDYAVHRRDAAGDAKPQPGPALQRELVELAVVGDRLGPGQGAILALPREPGGNDGHHC